MSDTAPADESASSRFIRAAGEVKEDPEHRMWAPARWVVQLVQYMIAIVVVTMAEAFKSILSGEGPKRRRQRVE